MYGELCCLCHFVSASDRAEDPEACNGKGSLRRRHGCRTVSLRLCNQVIEMFSVKRSADTCLVLKRPKSGRVISRGGSVDGGADGTGTAVVTHIASFDRRRITQGDLKRRNPVTSTKCQTMYAGDIIGCICVKAVAISKNLQSHESNDNNCKVFELEPGSVVIFRRGVGSIQSIIQRSNRKRSADLKTQCVVEISEIGPEGWIQWAYIDRGAWMLAFRKPRMDEARFAFGISKAFWLLETFQPHTVNNAVTRWCFVPQIKHPSRCKRYWRGSCLESSGRLRGLAQNSIQYLASNGRIRV